MNDTCVFDITAVSPLPEYSASNSFISSVSDVIRESGLTCEFSVSRQSLDVNCYLDSSYADFIGKRGSGDVDESAEALVQSMLEANTVTYEGFIDAGMYGVSTTLMMYDSGGVPLVRQDYMDRPGFYAELSAFQNGRMYQYPSSTSYYDNMEISLANCYYVGSVLYPERFGDVDFEAKASEIFDFFLGEPDYLSELEAYGAFYGAVDVSADA